MTSTHRVFVGIGSNLDNPQQHALKACEDLSGHPQMTLLAQSNWYLSKAVGPGEQADYVNGAALLETPLSPEELLDALQGIEREHQRVRKERWGPRTLDLDILLYNNDVIDSERLTIPHNEMAQRNFVLKPLLDLDAKLTLPDGRLVDDILNIIGTQDLSDLEVE